MKRKVLSVAACAGFALLAFSLVSIAQPTTSGGGLTRVQVTGGGLAGSGTTTNPLKIRSDCTDGQILKSTSGAWDCAADGGGPSGLTTNTIPKATSATTIGDSSITDNGSLVSTPLSVTLGNASNDTTTVNGSFSMTTIPAGARGALVQADANQTISFAAALEGTISSQWTSGTAPISAGVFGKSNSTRSSGTDLTNAGVYGESTIVTGSATNVGVYGIASGSTLNNYAGWFQGALNVTGNSTLGDAATDLVSIPGDLTVTDVVTFNGNTTIGDASSDTLTVNATTTHAAPTTVQELRGTAITSTATGTQNDLAPSGLGTATILLFNPSSTLTLTGLTGGAAGRNLTLCNVGTALVQVAHDNAGSTAANRFYTPGASTWTIPYSNYWAANGRECIDIVYNGTDSRWMFTRTTSQPHLEITSQLYVPGTAEFLSSVNLGNGEDDVLNVYGKPYTRGTAPALSSCGTSPNVVGNDKAGRITTGTGTPTACTLTFNAAWSTNAPSCVITARANVAAWISSAPSTTAFTVTLGTGTDSLAIDYICMGRL